MKTVRIARRASGDLDAIFRTSEAQHGSEAAERYRALVAAALRDLAAAPARPGVIVYAPRAGIHLYHLRHSRSSLPADVRVRRPRHLIAFRLEGDVITVVRVLHDAMDLPRRLERG